MSTPQRASPANGAVVMINTFRVFISSTFSDLAEVRERLAEDVLPAVEKHCRQNGVAFEAIDLRWGVSSEAAANQNAMRICLDELDKCITTGVRPALIVLLGDRYGARPAPFSLNAEIFDRACETVKTDAERALLEHWFLRDENAQPPQVLLRQRQGEELDPEYWEKTETALWNALDSAAKDGGIEELSAELLSATHQEIGRALAIDQGRTISLVGLRDAEELSPELQSLREELRELTGDRCIAFPHGDAGVRHLCDQMRERLITDIDAALEADSDSTPLTAEITAHSRFASDRRAFVVGRQDLQRELCRSVANAPDGAAIVVHGRGGVGKTALLASLAEDLRSRRSDLVVVERYIGATPGSVDAEELLLGIADEILAGMGAEAAAGGQLFEGARGRLRRALSQVTPDRGICVLIDGLDQLDLGLRSSIWDALRVEWPENCRLVVSAADGRTAEMALARLPDALPIVLEPLSRVDNIKILSHLLAERRRCLTEGQWAVVRTGLPEDATPLYMRLLAHEAESWRSFDDPPHAFPADIDSLLLSTVARLRNIGHAPLLVSRALVYLTLSRFGLSEPELLQVLFEDADVREEFFAAHPNSPATNALPLVIWARLKAQLSFLLREVEVDGTRLFSFYHRLVGESVGATFVREGERQRRHEALANYFGGIDHEEDTPDARRKCMELPALLQAAQRHDDLASLLGDYGFMMAKCRINEAGDLLLDLDQAWEKLPKECRTRIAGMRRFVQRNHHLLRRGRPGWSADRIALQLSMERLETDPLRQAAEKFLQGGGGKFLWLRRAWVDDDIAAVLDGHDGEVQGFVRVSADEGLSWSRDATIRRWRLSDGECLNVFSAEADIGDAAALSEAVVACRDDEILIWRTLDERLIHRKPAPTEDSWSRILAMSSTAALAMTRNGDFLTITLDNGKLACAPVPPVAGSTRESLSKTSAFRVLERFDDDTALYLHEGRAMRITLSSPAAPSEIDLGFKAYGADIVEGGVILSGKGLAVLHRNGRLQRISMPPDEAHLLPELPWRIETSADGIICTGSPFAEDDSPFAINRKRAVKVLDAQLQVIGEGTFIEGRGEETGTFNCLFWSGAMQDAAERQLVRTKQKRKLVGQDGAVLCESIILLQKHGHDIDLFDHPAHARLERAVAGAILRPEGGLISYRRDGLDDGGIYLWDDVTGDLEGRLPLHDETRDNEQTQLPPQVNGIVAVDGLYLSFGRSPEVPMWDPATGDVAAKFVATGSMEIFSVALMHEERGDEVAVAAMNSRGQVVIWKPYSNQGWAIDTGTSGMDYARRYENWFLREFDGDLVLGFRNLPIQRWQNKSIFSGGKAQADIAYHFTGADPGQARSFLTASLRSEDQVTEVLPLSGHRIAAALANGSIEIFQGSKPDPQATLPGNGLLETPSGDIVTWSGENGCARWAVAAPVPATRPTPPPVCITLPRFTMTQGRLARASDQVYHLAWRDDEEQSSEREVDCNAPVWRTEAPRFATLTGAALTPAGNVLTWASDRRYRVYAFEDGALNYEKPQLEAVFEAPALIAAHARATSSERTSKLEWTAWSVDRLVGLSAAEGDAICWHSDERCVVDDLREDGVIVARTRSGRLEVLNLYHGNQRVELPATEHGPFLRQSERSISAKKQRLVLKSRTLDRLRS